MRIKIAQGCEPVPVESEDKECFVEVSSLYDVKSPFTLHGMLTCLSSLCDVKSPFTPPGMLTYRDKKAALYRSMRILCMAYYAYFYAGID